MQVKMTRLQRMITKIMCVAVKRRHGKNVLTHQRTQPGAVPEMALAEAVAAVPVVVQSAVLQAHWKKNPWFVGAWHSSSP